MANPLLKIHMTTDLTLAAELYQNVKFPFLNGINASTTACT
jgi:hypothetical protein